MLDPNKKSLKEKLSQKCAKQNASGVFKHSHIRGYFKSKKTENPVYYGSSYELRLCWELDNDDNIKTYQTQIPYEVGGRGRCLDFLVTYQNGTQKAIEVKPELRLGEPDNIQHRHVKKNFNKYL